jgi:hypothetical protein
MNPELKETRELCKALTRFLGNYLQATRGTGDAAVAERAAGRVTDALTDCLSKTTIELAEPEPGRLPMTFECTACGQHDLARDKAVLASGQFRHAIDRGSIEERQRPVADYVVLMRACRYSQSHAKEVVRQLARRGYQSTAANVELVPA